MNENTTSASNPKQSTARSHQSSSSEKCVRSLFPSPGRSSTMTSPTETSSAKDTVQKLPLSSKKLSCGKSSFTPAFETSPFKCDEGPSPAKKSRITLDDFSKSMATFQEDFDTKLKATLYSMMMGDVNSAKDDLTRLRRTSHAFFNQSAFVLNELKMKAVATEQKLSTTENYNLHLHRQNNDLRDKIRYMKNDIASKEAQQALHIFDDAFDEDEMDDHNREEKVEDMSNKETDDSNIENA